MLPSSQPLRSTKPHEQNSRFEEFSAGVKQRLHFQGATYRRPTDVFSAVLALVALLITTLVLFATRGYFETLEFTLFRLINALPDLLSVPLQVIMQAGSFAAVPIVMLMALLLGRPLLLRNLMVSGVLAWFLNKVVKVLVDRGRPEDILESVIIRGSTQEGLGFPSGHVTIAAALATVASPYLGKWSRIALWLLVALVGLGRMYVGAHFPIDVVGGIALGILIGAAVNLLMGVPHEDLSRRFIEDAFREFGITLSEIKPVSADARGSVPYFARATTGERYFAKLVGAEQRNADFLFKVWRSLILKNVVNTAPFLTPKQQIEHEAYVTLLAKEHGVCVSDIIFSKRISDEYALLVQRQVAGTPLDECPADSLDDALLAQLWEQVRLLHDALIAHGDLRLANLLLDEEGRAYLIDFGFADAGASPAVLAQDGAQMLASLAAVVGVERAVASAVRGLGEEAVVAMMPALQPMALSSVTRDYVQEHPDFLEELQTSITEQTGIEAPQEAESVIRINPRSLLWLFGLGIGVYLLLPQIGELQEVVRLWSTIHPGWLIGGLALSLLSYVAATFSQWGSLRQPISLPKTFIAHFAATFANRFGPRGLGGAFVLTRFMEKSGIRRYQALAALTIKTVMGSLIHLLGMLATLFFLGQSVAEVADDIEGWQIGLVLLVVLGVVAYFFGPSERRKKTMRSVRSALRDLRAILKEPRKATALVGGAAGTTLAYIGTLAVSLWAVGAPIGIPQVAAVYLAGEIIGSASPTPGGIGVLEGAFVAGLVAFNVPSDQAVAGVLLYRLLTFWLPILPGFVASRYLEAKKLL